MAWYLLTSKPHSETKAAGKLQAQGYKCFLPMIQTEKTRRGIRSVNREPLFSRYLFVELAKGRDAFSKVKNTRGVAGFVSFGNYPSQVDEKVIQLLQAHCNERGIISSANIPQKNDEVEITNGPFKNLKAVFLHTDGEKRAMVLLTILQQKIPLSVDNSGIRKVG